MCSGIVFLVAIGLYGGVVVGSVVLSWRWALGEPSWRNLGVVLLAELLCAAWLTAAAAIGEWSCRRAGGYWALRERWRARCARLVFALLAATQVVGVLAVAAAWTAPAEDRINGVVVLGIFFWLLSWVAFFWCSLQWALATAATDVCPRLGWALLASSPVGVVPRLLLGPVLVLDEYLHCLLLLLLVSDRCALLPLVSPATADCITCIDPALPSVSVALLQRPADSV